jgi:hypothetical protein
MATKNSSTKLSKNQLLPIILAGLVLVLVGGLIFNRWQDSKSSSSQDTNQADDAEINLSPPTEEEIKAAQEHKDELVKQQNQQNQPTNGKVTPIIIDAGYYDNQLEVRSFVPGIFEAGGTCTVTASKGNEKVSKQSAASQGATTTDCPVTNIPRSELSAGSWTVVVSYVSTTNQGSSETRIVEVP